MEKQISSGALIYRIKNNELEVLLIHRKTKNDWSWPKGRKKRSETTYECAIREASEETGRQIILQRYLGKKIRENENRKRTIYYYAARIIDDGETGAILARNTIKIARVKEIDQIKWVNAKDIKDIITKKSDIKPLKTLCKYHSNKELDTNICIFLRHSYAENRALFYGKNDALRPLTDHGKLKAKKIIPLLSAFGINKIITSTSLRCLQTIWPYEKVSRTNSKKQKYLSEEGFDHTSKRAKKLLENALKSNGTVLCSHMPILSFFFTIIRKKCTKSALKKLKEIHAWKPAQMLVLFAKNDNTIVDIQFI
jgi:8-oxo-dGTP diphosphatase